MRAPVCRSRRPICRAISIAMSGTGGSQPPGSTRIATFRPTPRLEALRDRDIFPADQSGGISRPRSIRRWRRRSFSPSPGSASSVTAMKVAMVGFRGRHLCAFSCACSPRRGLPTARVVVYAWHPLPLWEFAGSGHIDAALIAFSSAPCGWPGRAARRACGALPGRCGADQVLSGWSCCRHCIGDGVGAAGGIRYRPSSSATCPSLRPAHASSAFCRDMPAKRGWTAMARGFYLLSVLRRSAAIRCIERRAPTSSDRGAILAALGTAVSFRRAWTRARPSSRAGAAGNGHSWFSYRRITLGTFAWLIVFACFFRSLALLWLTIACMLLYLGAGKLSVGTISGWLSNRSSTGRLRRWRWSTFGAIAARQARGARACRSARAKRRAPTRDRYFDHIADERGAIAEAEPVCLYLETTNRCNLLCTTCPRTFEALEPPGGHELGAVHRDRRPVSADRARRAAWRRRADDGAGAAAHDPLSEGPRHLRPVQHQRHAC